jgi:hypothetical protein
MSHKADRKAKFLAKQRAAAEADRIGRGLSSEKSHVRLSRRHRIDHARNREADRIDGFDRDDLGESPDF